MKKIIFLLSLFITISCSKSDNTPDSDNTTNITFTVIVDSVSSYEATISWTRPTNSEGSTIFYRIILNNETIVEDYQERTYTFTDLTDQSNYNGTVFSLDSNGNQTFAEFSFNTPLSLVHKGNYVINTQQKADDFYFTGITGSLTIQGPSVTDLSNLSVLTYVGQAIQVVEATSLLRLDGLENVTSIDPSSQSSNFNRIRLRDNPVLEDINALSEYCRLTNTISIEFNESLTSAGLEAIKVNQHIIYLEILRNHLLTNLNFLSEVETAEGRFLIFSLSNLTSLDGLNNLRSVVEPDFSLVLSGLILSNLPSLQSLEGLNNLQTSSHVGIALLPLITNLDALSSLSNGIDGLGEIDIGGNTSLIDFCGINTYANNIEIVFGGYSVKNNAYNPTLEQLRSTTECRQ